VRRPALPAPRQPHPAPARPARAPDRPLALPRNTPAVRTAAMPRFGLAHARAQGDPQGWPPRRQPCGLQL